MGIFTHKRKIGSLDGTEFIKNGIVDSQLRNWDVSLIDISDLQGKIVKIGEITYEDLNLLGPSTTLDVVFPDAKEANKFFLRGFAKITTPFTNQVYGFDYGYTSYSTNKVTNIVISQVSTSPINTLKFPNSEAQDINARITLAETNSQDWDNGVIEVYIEVKEYPI